MMGYEACRELPLSAVETVSVLPYYPAQNQLEHVAFLSQSSPMATFTGGKITGRIALIPILRAGSGMLDAMLELFPEASVYHLGLFRDKVSLTPTEYYSKLPGTEGAYRVITYHCQVAHLTSLLLRLCCRKEL